MKLDINLIFHESMVPGYFAESNQHIHTFKYYEFMQSYVSKVDPEFDIGINYQCVFTKSYKDVEVLPNCVNVVFVPMNYPLIQQLEKIEPTMLDDLYRLDDHSNVKLVLDYNNETLLPGNFDQRGKSGFVGEIDYSRFYCSNAGCNRDNVKDRCNFKHIIQNLCYFGYWYSKVLKEQPFIDEPNLIYTYKNKQAPIRYFAPSNMFRPGRAQCIVQMHHAGMLLDTEWNMNKFNDVFQQMEDAKISNTYKQNPYVDEYLELFGKAPRLMSWPWKKSFNKKRVLEDQGKFIEINPGAGLDNYDSFNTDLISNIQLYIVQETFSDYHGEEPIDPNKPMRVIDITEKTFKGFIYGLPMFLNARQDSCKTIEQLLGFDMLQDYNKFDYDSEPRTTQRIDQMLESAREFPAINDDIVDRLKQNKNRAVSKEHLWLLQKDFMDLMLDRKD